MGNPSRPALWRDIAVGLVVFGLYLLVDTLHSPERRAAADAGAHLLFRIERWSRLDIELSLNRWLAGHETLATVANYEYAFTYIVTAFVLLFWMYFRRPADYPRARDSFLLLNVLAIACFAVYPVTPPRLLPDLGFIDTVVVGGTWGSWGTPLVDGTNQLAALPSLHVGWAFWVSVVLARIAEGLVVQLLSALHVLVTVYVILATGNHFLLDAVAAAVFVAIAMLLVDRWYARSSVVPPADAFFLHIEDAGVPQQVGGMVVLRPGPGRNATVTDVRALVRGELANLPRFRQRLRLGGRFRRARWVDADIDWTWHVTEHVLETGSSPAHSGGTGNGSPAASRTDAGTLTRAGESVEATEHAAPLGSADGPAGPSHGSAGWSDGVSSVPEASQGSLGLPDGAAGVSDESAGRSDGLPRGTEIPRGSGRLSEGVSGVSDGSAGTCGSRGAVGPSHEGAVAGPADTESALAATVPESDALIDTPWTAEIARVVSELAADPLPRDRPLWRLVLVRDPVAGAVGVVLLLHHTVADGIGTVVQALHLLRPAIDLAVGDRRGPGRVARVAATATGFAQLATDARPPGRVPGGSPRRTFSVVALDLETVRAVARSRGARVTDVLLTVMVTTLHRMRPEWTEPLRGRLRVAVPLMVREPTSAAEGNLTAAVMTDVPFDSRSPAGLLTDIRARSARLHSGTRALASHFVMSTGLRLLPEPAVGWFARSVYGGGFFHAIVSNMAGPTGAMTFANVPIAQVFPILPPAPGVPLVAGVLSWHGVLGIGLSVDPALLDPAAFADELPRVLAELAEPAVAEPGPSVAPPPPAAAPVTDGARDRSGYEHET
ncbi:phosphatase PAP2 family protein [Nocardia sp. BMG51109]|uniref:bifunctional phosphatase PAP2/O-acyltransferase family protein n=1 Tax=Nocardia sp. BMG51109 TaxID=1056816 RepID=UPI000465D315|nr:phosphatase PAP2 family protein [Nocardia sp. BMG51109]